MIIGSPKEIKNHESRVGLNTASVGSLVDSGHKVYIEKDAGIKSGFSDEDYKKAGAEIVGSDNLVNDITAGKINFNKLVATRLAKDFPFIVSTGIPILKESLHVV